MKTENLYCTRAFKGIYIERALNNSSKVGACCISKTGESVNVINFQSDAFLQEIRKDFTENKRNPACERCWEQDDRGIKSLRYHSQYDAEPYKIQLEYIDYNVAPICNAKCITCGSYFSSSWAEEERRFGNEPLRNFNEIRQSRAEYDLDFTNVNRVYFNGGEPFLSPDVADLLNQIKNQTKLSRLNVCINTNGSVIPKPEVVDLLRECKYIQFYCSIDGIGKSFEYIRNPLDWKMVSDNLEKFAHIAHELVFTPNLGVHNALEWGKINSYAMDLAKRTGRNVKAQAHPTMGHYSFDNASQQLKDELLKRIPDDESHFIVRDIILRSESSSTREMWLERSLELDKRRGLNWEEYLPELAELWNDVKKRK